MNDLSLFGIESGLHDLFDAWQNAETPEQMEAAEVAIRACAQAEVRKVDGVRRYWRACEQMAAAAKHEAQVQTERARLWEARLGRLKAIVYEAMERFGRPKLEGQTGTLYLKGNGGKQAVEITDESMVPDEYKSVTVKMTQTQFDALMLIVASGVWPPAGSPLVNASDGAPSHSLIAEALARNCEKCLGTGSVCNFCHGFDDYCADVARCEYCKGTRVKVDRLEPCPDCGGTGKQGVPGARLAERGKHVECR